MDNINLQYTVPITWPEEFKEYHDIIYTRLDIPEPPVLDEDKFLWWCEKSENFLRTLPSTQYMKTDKVNLKYSSAYHDNMNVRKEPFPFTMYPAMSKYKSLTDDPWVENFDKLFPDMLDYYSYFPGKRFRSLGFLKQNSNMKVWDHTDADEWIGFRFYLKNNCTNDNLYFKKFKKEYFTGNRYTTYIDTGTTKLVRDFTGLIEDEKLYVKNNTGNYAWALTSTNATHGIEARPTGEARITGMMEFWPLNEPGVLSGFKVKETIDLFERSISKYKDEVLWYS